MDMTYAKLVHLLDHNPSLVEPFHFYRVLRQSIPKEFDCIVASAPTVSPEYRAVIRHLSRQLQQFPEQHALVRESFRYAAVRASFYGDPSACALERIDEWLMDFDAKIQHERSA